MSGILVPKSEHYLGAYARNLVYLAPEQIVALAAHAAAHLHQKRCALCCRRLCRRRCRCHGEPTNGDDFTPRLASRLACQHAVVCGDGWGGGGRRGSARGKH